MKYLSKVELSETIRNRPGEAVAHILKLQDGLKKAVADLSHIQNEMKQAEQGLLKMCEAFIASAKCEKCGGKLVIPKDGEE